MTYPKLLTIVTLLLFSTIGLLAFFKKEKPKSIQSEVIEYTKAPIEIELEKEVRPVVVTPPPKAIPVKTVAEPKIILPPPPVESDQPLPEANKIAHLFNKSEPQLPIVETVVYKSRAPWQKGRPAWLSDYANFYSTSRHFIARSLNGKPDYFKQDVAEGDRFNVFRKDKNINFHLLIDIKRSKMWFYYVDLDTNERVLLKTYRVGLGRVDPDRSSGLLTPLGKYSLGNKIAIYQPKVTGFYNGEKVEMIRIFGSRWIPFDKELGGCTAPAKGLGLHGVPWVATSSGSLAQDSSSLGEYKSDGCVRLNTEDIEEIFAIVITKPTTVEIVKDYYDAKLPGVEK